MNMIKKIAVDTLGYNYIPQQYIPKGKNEYYLRDVQNRSGITYRQLTSLEIEILVRNRNSSDNWNNILVSENFNPDLVRNCKFFGLIRIGKLTSVYLEFHAIRTPVGLYNSTIISCDFGDNVVIDNVNYLSHYIIGNEAIIVNVNEMANTNYSKFGNGIIKEGEDESIRIWMELCNENGGRSVIPFSGMLPGDAYLWTRNRDDAKLLEKFKQFTEKQLDKKRGYYGKVGDRTVIKNCAILKDVWIGSDAYLKGANKIKNVTVNSDAQRKSQIGEGCEIVNGIIGYGCRLFYGVKAVRFVMSSHSQLKYGARLINSYLGSNATISCCEVLNSLIFPSHEQHHNNSFLCAALIMGQSNLAAGATIGSNHNSRAADGEIIANRGFWPGLCVSLKHNSKFASFTMMAKGDYPNELNVTLPFSLVSNEVHTNSLVIMPAYWFMYNMYALARNAAKYAERDARTKKIQRLEFDYLAPDTINEMINAVALLEQWTGKAWYKAEGKKATPKEHIEKGKLLLGDIENINHLEILADGIENSTRKVKIIKVKEAYAAYKEMISYYCHNGLMEYYFNKANHKALLAKHSSKLNNFAAWDNVGGQLIPIAHITQLTKDIKLSRLKSWNDVRAFYVAEGEHYNDYKLLHSLYVADAFLNISYTNLTKVLVRNFINSTIDLNKKLQKAIKESRAKDYKNEFKLMTYTSKAEMDAVIGKLEDNTFIKKTAVAYNRTNKLLVNLLEKVK